MGMISHLIEIGNFLEFDQRKLFPCIPHTKFFCDIYLMLISIHPFHTFSMEADVMQSDKPFFMKNSKNEQLTFFNTLGKTKYQTKGVDGSVANYNYSKKTHVSTKTELKFVASLNNRTDYGCVIRYKGQAPTPTDGGANGATVKRKSVEIKVAEGLEAEKSASKSGAAGEGAAEAKEA